MIGVDLGNCIKQILEGKVAAGDVVKIYSPLDFANDRQVREFVHECKKHEWKGNPNRGEAILFELYTGGKIERYSPTGRGYPIADKLWVASEEEIQWRTLR